MIEITESALAQDTDAALETLGRLNDQGVQLAIDDFGTGYASLDYVRRFSMADQLKIDRSFVADLDSGRPRDQAIVSASLVLARDLGFTSVAEGTVYPILLRLEKKGLVALAKVRSELGPPRKYYKLTETGHQQLAEFRDYWQALTALIETLGE